MARSQKSPRKKKIAPALLRQVSIPLGVAIVGLLTPIAFAFAVLALNK